MGYETNRDRQHKVNISYLLFLFMAVSVGGWCAEVVFRSIFCQELVIPGFLAGPYCPIYGFGVVAAELLCNRKNKWICFAEILIMATVLEYAVSYAFEMLFHILLWDYSMIPLTIGTRVTLVFSIIWGILGVLFLKMAEPCIRRFYNRHRPGGNLVAEVVLLMMVTDTAVRMIGRQ